MKHLKKFETTSQYEAYTADTANFIKPNVSLCKDGSGVHYSPRVATETRVVATFNVTSTSEPTTIIGNFDTDVYSGFSAIEIDGVVQPSVVSAYTFDTTGEHTVKYTLVDQTNLGDIAFEDCGDLTSVVIPDNVITIGGEAFRACTNLENCTIGSGVTSIGGYAFYGCNSLTSINIPNSVTSIGTMAFFSCSFTSCTIGAGIISIGESAFDSCESLTNVTIGSGVTSIDDYAFLYCKALSSVTINATTPSTLGDGVFSSNASGRKIYVPSASVDVYKAASGWSTYASDIEAIQ